VFHPPLLLEIVRDDSTIRVCIFVAVFGPTPAEEAVLGAAVVVVDPLAVAEFDDSALLEGLTTGALAPAPDVAPADDEVGAALAGAALEGVKVPVRFQKAEKPLNGPPTTWLDHCKV
jgi:hypothetical protein